MSTLVSAIVLCAGSSSRMQGTDKIFTNLGGIPVIARTLMAFENSKSIGEIIVVTADENKEKIKTIASLYGINKLSGITKGGQCRAESVLCGLEYAKCAYTAITDGARPLVTPGLIDAACDAAFEHGASAPGLPVSDTLKLVGGDGIVKNTVDRTSLVRIQTPQVFQTKKYYDLLSRALTLDIEFTDDCSVWEYFGGSVFVTCGSPYNIKITYPEDIEFCERLISDMNVRIGHGYDVHRFKEGRPLWLCGEKIESDIGLDGHSDADVALHALTDAILGAAAMGDIGKLFPDTDMQYKDISSVILLKSAAGRVFEKYAFGNCDITIVAQKPKLLPYIEKMRKNIADALKTDIQNINVKATTEEHLGFTGRLEGISAHAVCTLYKK